MSGAECLPLPELVVALRDHRARMAELLAQLDVLQAHWRTGGTGGGAAVSHRHDTSLRLLTNLTALLGVRDRELGALVAELARPCQTATPPLSTHLQYVS